MASILSFISQKGGVGKSTLARLVARQLARLGLRVKIADLDTHQSTSTNWLRRRTELVTDEQGVAQFTAETPNVPAQLFPDVKHALDEADLCDVLVLDPGNEHPETLRIVEHSDFVVIPTTSSNDDLDPTVQLARELRKAGLPSDCLAIALCRTTGSPAAARAAREIVEGEGFTVLPGELPTKPTYESALADGHSLNETAYEGLNERANEIADAIIERLEAQTIAAKEEIA